MAYILLVERTYQEKATPSKISVWDGSEVIFTFFGLELPWKDNTRKISCIPEGSYKTVGRRTPKFGDHFHITDVPNRTWILIHQGNYTRQIQGCLLVGDAHVDMNKDGIIDVKNSVATMKKLNEILPNEFVTVFFEEGTDFHGHLFG
jgi:hypothetical protein